MKIERSFDYIDGKHVPTIKILLGPCLADDMKAWDKRDDLARSIEKFLVSNSELINLINDEAK